MDINERFETIKRDVFGGSQKAFADKIGVAPSVIANVTGPRRGKPSYDVLEKICANANICPGWLLTGSGQMLKPPEAPISVTSLPQPDIKIHAHHILDVANNGSHPIPLVIEKVAAGFGGTDFCIQETDVKDYYIIPKFRHCNVDFMIEVSGDSMMPHLYPGDVIACSILRDCKFIQWNKTHVIATRDQGLLVKRIFPGDDETNYTAISDNKDYPPFKIPLCDITGVALVVGSVSLE